jgi:hypothetical protein
VIENKEPDEKWKARAIVVRCPDQTYSELVQMISAKPDCYLVFSKTSNLKLVVREEGF